LTTEDGGSNIEGWLELVFSVLIVAGSDLSEGCCYHSELSFDRGILSASMLKNA